MSADSPILREAFDFERAVALTAERGYFLGTDAMSVVTRLALAAEIDGLTLEASDHVTSSINEGRPNEVRQQHERLYVEYGSNITPVANMVIDALTNTVRGMQQFPELQDWQPTEIGYQRYRHHNDFIGAHRDRSSDRLLSVTFTLSGSALVRMFEPIGDDRNYSNIRQIDEYDASGGSIMLLRASGLGNGGQIIHQVLPPSSESRSILNLRMRSAILGQS